VTVAEVCPDLVETKIIKIMLISEEKWKCGKKSKGIFKTQYFLILNMYVTMSLCNVSKYPSIMIRDV